MNRTARLHHASIMDSTTVWDANTRLKAFGAEIRSKSSSVKNHEIKITTPKPAVLVPSRSHTVTYGDTFHSTLGLGKPYIEHERHPLPEVQGVPVIWTGKKWKDAPKQVEKEPVLQSMLGRTYRLRRMLLHFIIIVAVLGVIAMGLALGVKLSKKHINESSTSSSNEGNSSSSSTGNQDKAPASGSKGNITRNAFTISKDTKITAANFTDEYGYDNALVFYQLNNRAIYMSAFNSSEDKWIVSPVIDGTGNVTLADVREGTSLGVDVYFHNESLRYVHFYYQSPDNVIQMLFRSCVWTNNVSNSSDWDSPFTYDIFTADNGSSIISYGRQSYLSINSAYVFFQTTSDGVRGGYLWGTNSQGFDDMLFPRAPTPILNTHLAVAGLPAINKSSRSLSVFYQSSSGVLSQLIYSGDGKYSSQSLPRGLIGRSAIAAFSTGLNGTNPQYRASTGMGYQVLTMDPNSNEGILMTYYSQGRWVAGGEVTDLSDCASRATMVATADQMVYCVVDGDNGTEIAQWKWAGDPLGSTDNFSRYKKVSIVDINAS